MFVRQIKDFLLRLFTMVYGLFHPLKKQILFFSYNGLYTDSGREISEQMHSLFPEYELVWLLKDKIDNYNIIPSYVKREFVKNDLTFYKQLAKSFCVIFNECFTPNMYKRKNQFFIQTWHGDRAFKKILYENDSSQNRSIDDKLVDICLAGSNKGNKMYNTAFHYTGKVLQNGMPRNDKLINGNIDSSVIKKKLNLPIDSKVLLYAPTFRDNLNNKQNVLVDLSRTLKVLQQKYPDNSWVCLIRAHFVSEGFNFEDKTGKFIDVSDYPDMTDLLCITDFLLTDYSSCAGDFVITKKPVILTVFDSEEYQQNCRSFRYPLEDTGFILAHNQTELENIITSLSEDKIKSHYDKIMNFYGITESGHSAEIVCKEIHSFYQAYLENKH